MFSASSPFVTRTTSYPASQEALGDDTVDLVVLGYQYPAQGSNARRTGRDYFGRVEARRTFRG